MPIAQHPVHLLPLGPLVRRYSSRSRSGWLLAATIAMLLLSAPRHARAQKPNSEQDSHELVTGQTEILVTPQQRQSAVDLLENVQQNFYVTMSRFPYTMKVSFTGSGNTQYEGEGSMESDEALPNWRWTSTVAGLTSTRMMVNGKNYGTPDPVPMRVQMVREALFRPIPGSPNQKAIRTSTVDFRGTPVTCVLLSGTAPSAGLARQWWDREYCVDPSTGRLMISSEAAGVYAIYDYTYAVNFHGHTLPGQITFFQAEKPVLEIHLDSMTDGVENAGTMFSNASTAALLGPTFDLGSAQWTPIRVDENTQGSLLRVEPVIVHATVSNETGKVIEAEAVGNSDLSARAVDVVRQTTHAPTGFQRDLYVAVEFYVRQ